MSETYIATQGVGEFLAGEVVTGLKKERVEELLKSGALVEESAEQVKLRKAMAEGDEGDENDVDPNEDAATAAKAAATKEAEAAAAKTTKTAK